MQAGDVIAERFEIVGLAGSGGMATVFRARDRESGEPVAVKLLRDHGTALAERFQREAQILAELRHPGIVRYVASGHTAAGDPYLAMEWLEGEDLAQRLARQGLTAPECVRLAARAAEALAVAHQRGIVHRDIKPSNLFLVAGEVGQVKVLDFGVARVAARASTRTGLMLGTPGYMAPEQARGDRQLDARADVFALGCVLFEALVGHPAFQGEHVMAVLAKILLEEAPRLCEVRPDLAGPLDGLLARMLAKDPARRPADAAALLGELTALDVAAAPAPAPSPSPSPPALTAGERRLLCVILAGGAPPGGPGAEATVITANPPLAAAPTVFAARAAAQLAAMEQIAHAHGARFERLAEGSAVVTLSGVGVATDQAARAARCALALRALLPEAPLSLATGRGVVEASWPMGEVIDRAAALLRGQIGPGSPFPVSIDETTAGLLDVRFDVSKTSGRMALQGERASTGSARTLLGKPTPCVGRDRELAALQALFAECVDEPVARAVVVTAPAGAGKTRLREELLARVRATCAEAEIWTARGDPLSAGAPFGLLSQALRQAAGIAEGEPLAARQERLRARLARHLAGDDLGRASEFLGELIGAPFPDEHSVQLRAARRDPMLMGDQMSRAWEDFIGAEIADHPVVLVLDDLHWGDLPTVRFVDAALRKAAEGPLCVLALARPEVEGAFPEMWAERGAQSIRLGPLTRKAGEKLVRAVLGEALGAERVAQLVERAAGNAFYLEELIRAAGEGGGDALPETVVAMLQARLEALDPEARRVLRAASVFGQTFWHGGVMALLGGAQRTSQATAWLSRLAELEIVERQAGGRFPAEQQYAFRHALVADAAYAMLTEADRALGHRLAGEWLESAGEPGALVLAQHFERGGARARAAGWYRRAAEEASEGNDLTAALARAERAIACGASGEDLGALRLLQAETQRWRGEHAEALARAREALERLPLGGRAWFRAASELAIAAHKASDVAQLLALDATLAGASRAGAKGAEGAFVIAAARLAWGMFTRGRHREGEALLDAIERAEAAGAGQEPIEAAAIQEARATRAMLRGDSADWLAYERETLACFERAGDLRHACEVRMNVGYALSELGAYGEATRVLREALAGAERMGLANIRATTKGNLVLPLLRQGMREEAERMARGSIAELLAIGDRRLENGGRVYLARLLAESGELDEAEREARRAVEGLAATPGLGVNAQALLARIHLLQGRLDEARVAAAEAMALLESLGEVEEGEADIRLIGPEVDRAAGDLERARRGIAAAHQRLMARADRINDPVLRDSFLTRVPEHARTLSLARAWEAVASQS